MHDGSIRYMGLGVVLYIMAPMIILYSAFTLISQGGNQMIDWLMSGTPAIASTPSVSVPDEPGTAAIHLTARPEPRDGGVNGLIQDWQPRKEWTEDTFTEEIERVIPMDMNGRFSVRNISGEIIITSWNQSEARIRAQKVVHAHDGTEAKEAFEEVTVEIEEHGGHVDVYTKYPDRREGWWGNRPHVSVHYEITVPRQAAVRANSVSGKVEVTAIQREVEAKSVSGHVRVEDIGSRVRAESVSGRVEASNLRGDADLQSVSGSIEVRAVTGDIEANTTSGRIELVGVTARRLSARTVSGTVSFEGGIMAQGRYHIESMSGNLRLMLPSDAAFNLRAETSSGSIDSDLPVTLQGAVSSRKGRQKSLNGVVNGGGAEVELSAFSGSIQIRTR